MSFFQTRCTGSSLLWSVEVDSQFRSPSEELPQLQLCDTTSEREGWTQTRDQDGHFSTANFFEGTWTEGTKLTFSKGKRGERQTDGGRGRGEVREKAVPSVEAKAVLQIQTQPSQL